MFQVVVFYVLGCWVYTFGTFVWDAPVLFDRRWAAGAFSGLSIRRARVCFTVGALIAIIISPLYVLYLVLMMILPSRGDV